MRCISSPVVLKSMLPAAARHAQKSNLRGTDVTFARQHTGKNSEVSREQVEQELALTA